MRIGRAPGIAALVLGLLILSVGIVVVAVVPSWGGWLHDYPQRVLEGPLPPESAPMVQGLINVVFGPLIAQVGEWVQLVGYFAGSVLIVLSLFPLGAGLAVLRMQGAPARDSRGQ
jgi:hypothetical protein